MRIVFDSLYKNKYTETPVLHNLVDLTKKL